MYILLNGTEAGVEVAKAYRDEFKDRIENEIVGLPGEKYRLLWVQNRIQFKNNLIDILEQKFKANLVIDELNHIWWSPLDESDPLRSLAYRNATHPLLGSLERRIQLLVQLAQEFKVDGVIHPTHWGCRQSNGSTRLIKDYFKHRGIPVLVLDGDCVVRTNSSEGQIQTRLQ